MDTAVIAGIVIGGIIVLAVLIYLIAFCVHKDVRDWTFKLIDKVSDKFFFKKSNETKKSSKPTRKRK